MRFSTYMTAAFLGLTISAVAQIKVCIGGNLDSLSTDQVKACEAKSASLQHEAQARGAQANWHFVVVCDEAGWNDYASFTSKDRDTVLASSEQVDAEFRTTFVRGSRLRADDREGLASLLASIPASAAGRTRAIAMVQQPASLPVTTNLMVARR